MHVLAALSLLGMTGCAREARYQMAVTPKGAVIRMDTATGEIVVFYNGQYGTIERLNIEKERGSLP